MESTGAQLLDEQLQGILGSRYQDLSHPVSPAARRRRRNHRVEFTLRMEAFLGALVFFWVWCVREGLMGAITGMVLIGVCAMTAGYFAGVCVSHWRRWRN